MFKVFLSRGQTQSKWPCYFWCISESYMFSLTVMYEVLNHYWKRGRMSLFASPGSTWNLQPVNLTLAFSRLVEMSRSLCRSELLVFSSFITKKWRQRCPLRGSVGYPAGPQCADDSMVIHFSSPSDRDAFFKIVYIWIKSTLCWK